MDTQQTDPVQDTPPVKKLYEGLKQEGLYTRDFDTFQDQYSKPEQQQRLYNGLKEEQLVSVDYSEFVGHYFPEQKTEATLEESKAVVPDNQAEEAVQTTPDQVAPQSPDDSWSELPESFQASTEGQIAGQSTGIDTGLATPSPTNVPMIDNPNRRPDLPEGSRYWHPPTALEKDKIADIDVIRDELNEINDSLGELRPERTGSPSVPGVPGSGATEKISDERERQIRVLDNRRRLLDQYIAAEYMPLYQQKLKLRRRKNELERVANRSSGGARRGSMGGGFQRDDRTDLTEEEREELNQVRDKLEKVDSRIEEIKPQGFEDRFGNALNAVAKASLEAPLLGVQGLAAWINGDETAESSMYQFAENAKIAVDEMMPTDPTLQEEFLSSILPSAFGSMASYVGIGAALAPAGAAATGLGVGAFAASSGSGQAYESAIEAGASPEDATVASRWGAIPGVLQVLPVMRVLDRYDKASGGQLKSQILKTLTEKGALQAAKRGAKQAGGSVITGLDEAIVEAGGEALQNVIANQVYEANKDIFEGTDKAALGGFGAGFSIDAMMSFLGARGPKGRATISQTADQKRVNDAITNVNRKLYGDPKETQGTESSPGAETQEQQLRPDIQFEWNPDDPVADQIVQLNEERGKLQRIKEKNDGDAELIQDVDTAIEAIDEQITNLNDQVSDQADVQDVQQEESTSEVEVEGESTPQDTPQVETTPYNISEQIQDIDFSESNLSSEQAQALPSLKDQAQQAGNERLASWVEQNPAYEKYSVNLDKRDGKTITTIINKDTGKPINRQSSAYDEVASRIVADQFKDAPRIDTEMQPESGQFGEYFNDVRDNATNPIEVLEAIESYQGMGLNETSVHDENPIRQNFFTPETRLNTRDVKQFYSYSQIQDDPYLRTKFSQDGERAESISMSLDRDFGMGEISPEQVIEEFINYREDIRGLSKKPFENSTLNKMADRFETLTGVPYSERLSNLALEEVQEQRLGIEREQAEEFRNIFMDDDGNVSFNEMTERIQREGAPEEIAEYFGGIEQQFINQQIQNEQSGQQAQAQEPTPQRPQEDSGLDGEPEGRSEETTGTEPQGESGAQGPPRKSALERAIEGEGADKSDYIKRRLKDVRDNPLVNQSLESIGDYSIRSVEAADRESNSLIQDLQQQFGDRQGLSEAFGLLQDNVIPDLMVGPMADKIALRMQRLGMDSDAIQVIDWYQLKLRDSARVMRGARSDASLESTVSRAFAGLDKKKAEVIKQEFKDGKTYEDTLNDILKKLEDIDKKFKPQPPKKKKERKKTEWGENNKGVTKSEAEQIRQELLKRMSNLNVGIDPKTLALSAKLGAFHIEAGARKFGEFASQMIDDLGENIKPYLADIYREAKKELPEDINRSDLSTPQEVAAEQAKIRREMIRAANEILKPKGREGKKGAEAREKASENIVDGFLEGHNLEKLASHIAELAGFENITQAERNRILDGVVEVSDLINDGKKELAAAKFDELMNELIDMNLMQREGAEIIQDLWYTSVLSGLTTIERSHLGSFMTSTIYTGTTVLSNPKIMPLAVSQMIKGFQGSWGTYKHVVKTGQTDVQFADFKPNKPSYTNKIARARYEELNARDKTMKAFMAMPIRFYRTILAFDQVLKQGQSEAYQAIFHYDKELDSNKSHTDAVKAVKEKLSLEYEESAKQQARDEIEDMKQQKEKVPDGYYQRRWREILNNRRDEEVVRKAFEESALAAMVSHPRGALGSMYAGWDQGIRPKPTDEFAVQAGKLGVRALFPFLRVAINYTNIGLDFTPVGLVRGTKSKNVWTKDGTRPRTRTEKRTSILRSAIGLSVWTSIVASMFRWDEDEENFKLRDEEDRWIEVVGPATGNWWEEKDISKDFKPWSVRFKNPVTGDWSKYRTFIDNPIGFALAPIGIMSDEIRFRNFRRDARGQDYADEQRGIGYLFGTGIRGIVQYTFDQSFNQGLNTISKIASAQSNETMNKAVQDAFLRPAEGFYPGVYHQMYAQYRALMNIPEKQANKWYERPLVKVPFANGLLKNHRFDTFGYPIIREFDVPMFPEILLKQATDNVNYREGKPEWELLWKYPEVTIGNFLAPFVHDGERLTDDQKNRYQEEAGLRFRESVTRRISQLDRLEAEELQKELYRLRRRAKASARTIVLEGRGRSLSEEREE